MVVGGEQSMLAEEPPEEVYETSFARPHPNPANPSTEFHFSLEKASPVELMIYNQRGEKVWELEPRTYAAGPRMVQWTGVDHGGKGVASGVYFVKMQASGESLHHRVTLVK
jgi:flagellar hook assembly protein FlgD